MASTSNTGGPADGVTVMAIGDVHLGTRPASVPDSVPDRDRLTPAAALAAAVEHAIAARVDAVLFAGDVVESTNARFEAMPPLERAVLDLSRAAIPVYAVAGNHDVDALPRLASMIDGFTLIGEGGRWESVVLEKDGRAALEIVGWSFPERRVESSPVAALLNEPLAPRAPDVARLGVLHGDLDASGGGYAPFASREVALAGLDAWVFGHIHRPSLAPGDGGLRGYLGSLVGLDPTETGPHGPWLLRVRGKTGIGAEQVPLAPLRWELLPVEVGEDEAVEDLGDRLLGEIDRLARTLHESGCEPRALGVRIRLTGPTRHHDAIRRRIGDGTWESEMRRQVGDTAVFVNRVVDDLRLAVDLEEMAKGDDPPALLARKLLDLRAGGPAARVLVEQARSALRATVEDPLWAPLGDVREPHDPLADAALREVLLRSGTAALDALLAQRDGAGGEPS